MGVNIEILHKIFQEKTNGHTLEFRGKCCVCSQEAIMKITKTSSGYGFIGGVIHETDLTNFIIKCDVCYQQGEKSMG